MNEKPIKPNQIRDHYSELIKRLLVKKELSKADEVTLDSVMMVKDHFILTEKPSNMYFFLMLKPVNCNGTLMPAFEIRLKYGKDDDETMIDANDRILIVGQGTDYTRIENTTVSCCQIKDRSLDTVSWKEMKTGEVEEEVINNGLNYLMFGLIPPREEVKHTVH